MFNSKKKTITLFDMDGTLTEARKPFDRDLFPVLSKLANVSDIGIVSGSDYEYIKEQMHFIMYTSSLRYMTHIFPCNGTKHYTPPEHSDDDFTLKYEVNMRDEIGVEPFRDLMRMILKQQVAHSSKLPSLSGHFVDYRGSMINWCPIGRKASQQQREEFVRWDASYNFRGVEMLYLSTFKTLHANNIQIKLGGDTSFDIYPEGWDKTYCLRHLQNYNKIYFVGDRCGLGGNDKELYDELQPNNSFATKNPKNTIEIVEKLIYKILKEGSYQFT